MPQIDVPLKKKKVREAVRTNTENYLSLITQDPIIEKQIFPKKEILGTNEHLNLGKLTENKITETHMTVINDK